LKDEDMFKLMIVLVQISLPLNPLVAYLISFGAFNKVHRFLLRK